MTSIKLLQFKLLLFVLLIMQKYNAISGIWFFNGVGGPPLWPNRLNRGGYNYNGHQYGNGCGTIDPKSCLGINNPSINPCVGYFYNERYWPKCTTPRNNIQWTLYNTDFKDPGDYNTYYPSYGHSNYGLYASASFPHYRTAKGKNGFIQS